MNLGSFIIFILGLIVQSVSPQPCNIYNSVNITDGLIYNNEIFHNNVIYDPRFYFLSNQSYEYTTGVIINVKDHLRGCLCKLPNSICIRLCCRLNHVYVNKVKRCVFNSNITLPEYHEIAKNNAILIGKPCRRMYQLEPELFSSDAFVFRDNGELLLLDGKDYAHQDICLAVHQETEQTDMVFKVNICSDNKEPLECDLTVDKTIFDIYPYALIISIIFLVVIILIYSFVPELRNLHGKCVLCYVCGLSLAYTMLAYLRFNPDTDTKLCVAFGFTGIYAFIFSFVWLNAMCVDIYWTFRGLTSSKRISDGRKFIIYSVYTWGITLAMLLFAIIMQFSDMAVDFGPGIGETGCWIKKQWKAELIYLYLPVAIVLIINTTLFVLTAVTISELKRESDAFAKEGDSRKHTIKHNSKSFNLFLRLFIVMGITWIFEVISWITEINYGKHWISHIPDLCNALQGVLVFFFVLWNKKVKVLIVKRYRMMRGLIEVSTLSTLSSRKTSNSSANSNSVSMNTNCISFN